MGSIQDLLQEVPLAAVLRERVALADQKYEAALREVGDLKRKVGDLQQKIAALEQENTRLRAQIPQNTEDPLSTDAARVLVHIFRRGTMEERDVGAMAVALGMERGVLQYHLDRFKQDGLADVTGGNYLHGHVYWALTPEGRRRVVEDKLI
jgi:DNA-binding MarR family transcriptional regulator